jgi:hypothetical protein
MVWLSFEELSWNRIFQLKSIMLDLQPSFELVGMTVMLGNILRNTFVDTVPVRYVRDMVHN